MSSSRSKYPYSDILVEKAYLTSKEWMDIYSSVTKSEQEEYLREASSLKYNKKIKDEVKWLKKELLTTGKKILKKKAERRLRLKGKIDLALINEIKLLLENTPFIVNKMRIKRSETIIVGKNNAITVLEKIFSEYSEKIKITPFKERGFFTLWGNTKFKLVGEINKTTITKRLESTEFKLYKYKVQESELDIEIATGIPVDDPIFELLNVIGKYKNLIAVDADETYVENWKKIIDEEVNKAKNVKLKPQQSLSAITDAFYQLDYRIDSEVPTNEV